MGLSIVLLASFFGAVTASILLFLLGSGLLGAILTYASIGIFVVLGWLLSELMQTPFDQVRTLA